jgi:hypothetical protein
MEVFMATDTTTEKYKRLQKDYNELVDLLERLLVVANDERYRNLSRFMRMRELLNEWDDEETDR